jgi:hypothetical protein
MNHIYMGGVPCVVRQCHDLAVSFTIVTPKREIPRKMIAERLKVDILESKPFFG